MLGLPKSVSRVVKQWIGPFYFHRIILFMENKMNTTDNVLIVFGLSSAVVIGLILYYFLGRNPGMNNNPGKVNGGKEDTNQNGSNQNLENNEVLHKLRFLFFFLSFLFLGIVLFSGLAYFGTLSYV